MSLYFIILTASFSIPFILSFEKSLRFYTYWKKIFPAIFLTAVIYIFFDVIFTKNGVWGFNPVYLSGIYLFNLPIEECLFFIVIPYSSLFLHFALQLHFPKFRLNKTTNNVVNAILILLGLALIFFNTDKQYTFYVFVKLVLVVSVLQFTNSKITQTFYPSFLIILIPFLIVNGILTGSFIENEIVWYNNSENLALRFFTIPVEDFAYALSMLLYTLFFIQLFFSKPKLNDSK